MKQVCLSAVFGYLKQADYECNIHFRPEETGKHGYCAPCLKKHKKFRLAVEADNSTEDEEA